MEEWMLLPEPLGKGSARGVNLRATLAVLADGKPRTASEIVRAGIAAGLLPRTAHARVLYVSLLQYLARATKSGRLQLIVQDPDRRFRTNHPIDDWPEPDVPLPSRSAVGNVAAYEKRLHDLSHGDDPAAFEHAICEAFGALGFVARHVGGKGAPDGVLDAPLGSLAYRVMLECKTASGNAVPRPDAAEAAKWRTAYGADYAMIIGPSFGESDSEFTSELDEHHVSAWTVDDLVAALRIGADPDELRPVFAPGYAEDHVPAVIWERTHGFAKRVAVAAQLLREAVWRRQIAVLEHRGDAPVITEDSAMVLVDESSNVEVPRRSPHARTSARHSPISPRRSFGRHAGSTSPGRRSSSLRRRLANLYLLESRRNALWFDAPDTGFDSKRLYSQPPASARSDAQSRRRLRAPAVRWR